MRCELMELHHIVIGDVTLAESGIEDLGSSADSQHEVRRHDERGEE